MKLKKENPIDQKIEEAIRTASLLEKKIGESAGSPDGMISPEELLQYRKVYASIDGARELGHFKRRNNRRWWLRATASAASVLLLAGAGYFLSTRQQTASPALAVIHPGSSKAYLELDNGETFSLTGEQGVLVRDGQVVDIPGGEGLVYDTSAVRESVTPRQNRLITPRGGEYSLVLSDGTRVWLNAESELEYPEVFQIEERRVKLTGEAYFEVAANSSRPFIITTATTSVRVYGTSFSVRAYPGFHHQTVLISGSVGVTGLSGEEYRLQPSQLADFDPEGRLAGINRVDINTYIGWRDGFFVFENESLEEILRTLSRWYDTEVVFQSEEIKEYRFTGHMERYEEITTILNAISKMVGVSFRINETTVYVSK